MTTVRHFTATGFVVHDGHVLLHWHAKVQAWLPPGGHVAENEDPVQAVLREVEEEAGVIAKIVPSVPSFEFDYPTQVSPPFTILVEDIDDPVDGYHQHIDMIYMCRLVGRPGLLNDGWLWVSKDTLSDGRSISRGYGSPMAPPEDVRLLALHAFQIVEGAR